MDLTIRLTLADHAVEAGVQFENPDCGICGQQVVINEEVCMTSTTRNYHCRMGGSTFSGARICLASPATVTAAAIAGRIDDPSEGLNV